MQNEKIKRIKNILFDYYPFMVLVLFILLFTFGFDRARMRFADIMSVPIVPINIFSACLIISLFGILITLFSKQFKLDIIAWLLLMRIILFVFASFDVAGYEYKLVVLYSVVQCFIAYMIGKNYKKDFKYIYILLFVFSIFVSLEIFYIPIKNDVNFFPVADSPSKYYMELPMGKHNFITCMLIPLYLLLTNCFIKNKKVYIIYSLFIGLAVLVTSSRWGFIMYLLFTFINNIDNLKKVILSKKYLNVLLIIVLMVLLFCGIFWKQIYEIIVNVVSRYSLSIFSSRLAIFKESLSLFIKHPLFGRTGYSYLIAKSTSAHNFILESLVQTGIVGTIILFICLYLVIKKIQTIKDLNVRKGYLLFVVSFLFQGLAETNMFSLRADFYFWLIVSFGIANSFINNSKKL